MMNTRISIILARLLTVSASALMILLSGPAAAHSPICYCYFEGDNEVLCEGGFTDGASAEGVDMRVLDERERVLIAGKINADQIFVFEMPEVEFHVMFDAGDNHQVVIYQDEIE